MAKQVTVIVSGGSPQVLNDVSTVGDIKERLGKQSFLAKVNGESADDEDELDDYSHVTLAENVKGGC